MREGEDGVETVEVQTAVTTPAPVSNSQQPIASGQPPLADLGKVRDLVLRAHPDVVPDLIAGGSVDELLASVEPARSAYQRIADRVRETESGVGSRESEVSSDVASGNDPPTSDPVVTQPPAVPAGGATNVVEPGEFAPTTRIAQALAARKQK